MSAFFSIIIPVYNVRDYINDCVASVTSQPYHNYEIILVNDGSTDGSELICQTLCKKFKKINLINQKNQGLSEARNTGLNYASGKYVIFLDSDDLLVDNSLKILADHINKNKNIDVWFCNYQKLIGTNLLKPLSYPLVIPDICDKDRDIVLFKYMPTSVWNVWRYIVKLSFLKNNNLYFFSHIYCEDLEWTPRLIKLANKIGIIEYSYYIYRYQRPGSIMNSFKLKRAYDLIFGIKKSLMLFDGIDNYKYLKLALIKEYIALFAYLDKKHIYYKKLYSILNDNKEILKCSNFIIIKLIYTTIKVFGINILGKFIFIIKKLYNLSKNPIIVRVIKYK